jgi:hypothetical protein
MSPARIIATHPEYRVVDVAWMGTETTKHNVIVVNEYGSYSFPKVGDTGLVLGNGFQYYFLGKIEYGYNVKIEGKYKNPDTGEMIDVVDTQTGAKVQAKNVKDGEILLANFVKRIWLALSNSGDFSLVNGLSEGLRYYTKDRLLKLTGMVVQVVGNGLEAAFGTRVRALTGVGLTPVPDETLKAPATEFFVLLKKLGVKTERLHLGYVSDSMVGADEFGSFGGARLKALLEVCKGGIPVAVLKMDEAGGVELSSTTTNVMLNATLGLIQLGGIGAMNPAVKGTELFSVLTNFWTAFASVPPVTDPASAAIFCAALQTAAITALANITGILSTKVMLA